MGAVTKSPIPLQIAPRIVRPIIASQKKERVPFRLLGQGGTDPEGFQGTYLSIHNLKSEETELDSPDYLRNYEQNQAQGND